METTILHRVIIGVLLGFSRVQGFRVLGFQGLVFVYDQVQHKLGYLQPQ